FWQTLRADTVQITSVPGTTFAAGTRRTTRLPCASTVRCSTSATVRSSMQPSATAAPSGANAMRPASTMRWNFVMVVSFPCWSLVDRYVEARGLRTVGLREVAERDAHGRRGTRAELPGVGVGGVRERGAVEL